MPTSGARRFECRQGTSNKFWEVRILNGGRHEVTFGRIGTNGQSKEIQHGSAGECKRKVEALIRSKLNKGYVEVLTWRDDPGAPLGAADLAKAKRLSDRVEARERARTAARAASPPPKPKPKPKLKPKPAPKPKPKPEPARRFRRYRPKLRIDDD